MPPMVVKMKLLSAKLQIEKLPALLDQADGVYNKFPTLFWREEAQPNGYYVNHQSNEEMAWSKKKYIKLLQKSITWKKAMKQIEKVYFRKGPNDENC